jgi:hypothetical protein
VDKIREPLFTGTRFQSARNENDKMWFQNMKIKLIVLGIIIFLSVNSHRHHRVNSHNSHIALQVDGKLFPVYVLLFLFFGGLFLMYFI